MKTYKDYAEDDLKEAKILVAFEMWNKIGRASAQCVEKILKYHLEQNHLLTSELSRTHNSKKLLRAIGNDDNELRKKVSLVADYYFTTNYPGDDSYDLDESLALEAISIAEEIMGFVLGYDEFM